MTAAASPLLQDRARRMRIAATGMLVVMAAVFLVSGRFEGAHWAWGYVHAFAEAGLVGGLADWFAVTALFRRPLGLPIPHTAIIPENKDRIADTMAVFLRENFLIPQVVARRMKDMNLAGAAGNFLSEPGREGPSRIRAGATELFAELLESLDPERLGTQVRSGLASQLERIEVAPLFGRMMEVAMADRKHLPLVDSTIRWAGLVLEDNETMVRDMIHDRANALLRFTGLDERLANSVLDGLYKLLAEVLVDPNHPLRDKLEEGLETLARDLQHDEDFRARVEKLKNELIANPAVAEWWQRVWERIRQSLIKRARDPQSSLGAQFAESLDDLGNALREDERLQWQINRFARRTAVGVATRHGDQIVQLVSETVRRWDARTLTDRLEGAVGRDLQFIRINGTLVGGLVGLTLHGLTQLW
ncbi:DUF445 domain-containing protein [Alteriqipengyuania flavescens]|uniref:DUF445 domain-containing protein n=1 Tax=Alteriqipengyuania flavescens TaxID=3053610 RepID=UPI0025B3F16D|nr:DUF445 domain-containing protein [Alteriqipengyuania flavescens]WJY19531.1 DUF445 domain-containing protein [Alteriqipengyuania flavescens]WJY25472.1 DUF445 domain-containing protein [Alteriqipengyuania flavescens]